MAQGYSRKSGNRSGQKKPVEQKSSLGPFLAGLVIGGLGVQFGPMLLERSPDSSIKQSITIATEAAKAPSLTFTFDDVFKTSEVIISKDELVVDKKAAPDEDSNYLLQIGSFRNKNDAESLRGQVTLLNLSANIETFVNNSGEQWHRVLVGPFANSSKKASAQARLAENRINSLLIQRKIQR
jgi:cell division protein FtsN